MLEPSTAAGTVIRRNDCVGAVINKDNDDDVVVDDDDDDDDGDDDDDDPGASFQGCNESN